MAQVTVTVTEPPARKSPVLVATCRLRQTRPLSAREVAADLAAAVWAPAADRAIEALPA